MQENLTCLLVRLITSQIAVSGGLYGTFGTQGLPDIRIPYPMYLFVYLTTSWRDLTIFTGYPLMFSSSVLHIPFSSLLT